MESGKSSSADAFVLRRADPSRTVFEQRPTTANVSPYVRDDSSTRRSFDSRGKRVARVTRHRADTSFVRRWDSRAPTIPRGIARWEAEVSPVVARRSIDGTDAHFGKIERCQTDRRNDSYSRVSSRVTVVIISNSHGRRTK